jgi:two-component system, sensor histidine kinase
MQLNVRTYLLLLGLATLIAMAAVAVAVRFILQTEPADWPLDQELLIAAGLGVIAGGWLLCALAVARRISRDIDSLGAIGKALFSGTAALPPDKSRLSEVAEVGRALATAANAARGRESALRSADRIKDEFFAMLSHELRNPLATQAAAAQILRKNTASQKSISHAAEVVARQVEHMTRLVEDLLDISRITRGRVSLNRQPSNLGQLTEDTVREMQAAGRLARHELQLDIAPVWARVDESRFAQVVSNLLGNAVKYTPERGKIALTLRRDGDAAVLRVHDSGIGMAPELAARVFDLFVQGENTPQRGAGGLGIGLTLVKHLAELHGGKVFAASTGPGQGSVFTVSLPAIEAQSDDELRAAAGNEVPHPPHRIVLIEDNDDARRTLVDALALDGHKIYEAADGKSGIQAVARVNPDVAVIDLMLPDLTGFEVAETLRDTPERDSMVLIALTASGRPDSMRRAHDAGFDEYVTKPIAPQRLVRLIDVAVAARARRAQSGGIVRK